MSSFSYEDCIICICSGKTALTDKFIFSSFFDVCPISSAPTSALIFFIDLIFYNSCLWRIPRRFLKLASRFILWLLLLICLFIAGNEQFEKINLRQIFESALLHDCYMTIYGYYLNSSVNTLSSRAWWWLLWCWLWWQRYWWQWCLWWSWS